MLRTQRLWGIPASSRATLTVHPRTDGSSPLQDVMCRRGHKGRGMYDTGRALLDQGTGDQVTWLFSQVVPFIRLHRFWCAFRVNPWSPERSHDSPWGRVVYMYYLVIPLEFDRKTGNGSSPLKALSKCYTKNTCWDNLFIFSCIFYPLIYLM